MTLFRTLDTKEEKLFRQWAIDVFTPNMEVNPLWHPVVREEIARLQDLHDIAQEDIETPLYEEYDGQYDNDPSPYDGTYSED